ncbi:MAG: VCBS repeat-containing protein, partial [Deltaproteobacteria bacterium]|nr:VCBS repeat-containing protein [Deltaproteobacteria bacterium]
MRLGSALIAIIIPLTLGGCTIIEEEGRFDPGDGPGQTPWNHNENVHCPNGNECGAGEVCEDGICQMARCVEPYTSHPPMGINHYFGTDGEMAIISDSSWVDAFEGNGGAYINSWDLSGEGAQIVDVAGGNLTGSRPQSVAAAIEFSDTVKMFNANGVTDLNVGIWPKAIASGDVDADGIDELIAFSAGGEITLCQVELGQCSGATIQGVQGKDVAVGDVDGDGFEEPIFLIDHGGETEIIVWNTDAEQTGQEETVGWQFNFPVSSFGVGDLDGDKVAEIVALEDGGWWGWANDKLHIFSAATEQFVATHDVYGHTLDVAVGDRNSDDTDEIVVLREDHKFELLTMNSSQQVSSIGTYDITVGETAQRISMLDWDGDSASGRLLNPEPELVAGRAVPVAALMFPPFPNKVAVGALSASITLGDVESLDETMSDTLSLGVGIGLSFGAETPIFKAKVGGYLNTSISVTQSVTKSYQVGARYWILAQPDLHGTAYAPVIMSCGCYHKYQYITDDPAGTIGGSNQTVDIYVPVGGQTQLWSSKRYNAMAEATGWAVPKIEIPIRVGDVSSYPNTLQTLEGAPIPTEDILFPFTPSYQISDVGFVSFWLSVGESETNSVA